jgi:hypothetical protein
MNREDVIRLAREAGFDPHDMSDDFTCNLENIERFADLVASYEREWCAKIVEPSEEHRREASWAYLGGVEGVELLDSLAALIRARSNV